MSSNESDSGSGSGSSGGSLLRQTLMTVDECFVYKIPPMTTSGGHRAEQWDLAKPLQTCGFQIERRDNDLYLLFTTNNHSKLFALSHIPETKSIATAVQSVVDSSRYFVTQISAGGKKTATVGFGFRDRDVAVDLLGTLQGFQKSIEREKLAKQQFDKLPVVPKLAPNEKIHINLGGKHKSNEKKKTSTSTPTSSSQPIMLKKPPKFQSPEERSIQQSMGTMTINNENDASKDAQVPAAVGSGDEKPTVEDSPDDTNHKNNNYDDDDDDGFDDDDFGDFQQAGSS